MTTAITAAPTPPFALAPEVSPARAVPANTRGYQERSRTPEQQADWEFILEGLASIMLDCGLALRTRAEWIALADAGTVTIPTLLHVLDADADMTVAYARVQARLAAAQRTAA